MKRAFYNSLSAVRNVLSPLVKGAARIQTNVLSVTPGLFVRSVFEVLLWLCVGGAINYVAFIGLRGGSVKLPMSPSGAGEYGHAASHRKSH